MEEKKKKKFVCAMCDPYCVFHHIFFFFSFGAARVGGVDGGFFFIFFFDVCTARSISPCKVFLAYPFFFSSRTTSHEDGDFFIHLSLLYLVQYDYPFCDQGVDQAL